MSNEVEHTAVPESATHEACEAALAASVDAQKRALADYQNLKREFNEFRNNAPHWALKPFLKDFLPTLHYLKLAVMHQPHLEGMDEELKNWVQGVLNLERQLEDVLAKHGIKRIESIGAVFSPMRHEAAGEEEGEASGVILKELQAGYEHNGEVILPARVIIAKGNDNEQPKTIS